ncbi:hypothetical protein SI65_09924 [Aspergillus cristatus]|uniref:Uncharacterized protein n=1 Tax=Aspergillus cristatus TaxID=573508 RepID=A0A1E3B1C9_ASPCR|nr:hypothetical protein SI65_09924 [Aspergillus cristatus]
MKTQRLRGGGILHASPPGVGNAAPQLAEAQDMSITPTPTHWRSGNVMQHVLDDGSMESANASKHAQVLVGALEAAQTQQQDIYQMVREQVQEHLAEELSNWRAEKQIHEGIYLEWITKLELEVSKLRTELTEARHNIQHNGPEKQDTPAINA